MSVRVRPLELASQSATKVPALMPSLLTPWHLQRLFQAWELQQHHPLPLLAPSSV